MKNAALMFSESGEIAAKPPHYPAGVTEKVRIPKDTHCSLSKSIFRQTGRGRRSAKAKQTELVGVHRYGRVRFAIEVKMSCVASSLIFTYHPENPPFNEYFILTVWGFFDTLKCPPHGRWAFMGGIIRQPWRGGSARPRPRR